MKSKRKELARALLDSVVLSDIARVRELLDQGADVNVGDEEHNETALMFAVKFANAEMVHLLLDLGAEVDARDDHGRTALFHAPVMSAVFEALLSAGADIHARDIEGNTILMQKISGSASLAEVEELLRLGIDPKQQSEDGETALNIAESLGLVRIVDRLRASPDQ